MLRANWALISVFLIGGVVTGDRSERAAYLPDGGKIVAIFAVGENQNCRCPMNSVRVILIKNANIQKNADLSEGVELELARWYVDDRPR